ncbi:hypothetical protein [Paenibacillus sp. FSL R7-0337]|uniref:hypothetical protein n=1 Tax=Paenibacillus sp. FSL R7-0337 TaxID=1926588 RepID=UPI00096D49F7|nr:hypothetical protein [Paenibacillus sp. FSL R7-0337]OMF96977.1 hypothetical protein BK147_12550 [Paenibacillus sp. FSL R7-0337]
MGTFKKPAALLLPAVLLMTLLAGCQSDSAAPAATPSAEPTAEAVSTAAPEASATPAAEPAATEAATAEPTPAASAGSSEAIKEGTIEKEGNVILKELAFVHKDHTIALSDIVDDTKLESMLGKATAKKSHTYSLDDGKNMDTLIGRTENTYTFPGLEIKTIDSGDGKQFYIFSMKITDPKYTTVRNIKVGDSLDTLKKAYPEGKLTGDGAPEEEDDYRFAPSNYVDYILFHVKGAKIESISISTLLD